MCPLYDTVRIAYIVHLHRLHRVLFTDRNLYYVVNLYDDSTFPSSKNMCIPIYGKQSYEVVYSLHEIHSAREYIYTYNTAQLVGSVYLSD